jgi:hypothetical protein
LARQLEETTVKLSTMVAFLALAVSAPLGAQGRDRDKGSDDVPAGYRPPPGMCRVWVDGVPPGQQPAPTDCRTAIRGDKSKVPELLKEFRRKKDENDRKDDEKSDKGKRYRKP